MLGWGGTFGAIAESMKILNTGGTQISHAHLNYLSPFPKNLGDVLKKFEKILIPELNMGHLLFMVRAFFPGVSAFGINKVKGHPFHVAELTAKIKEYL